MDSIDKKNVWRTINYVCDCVCVCTCIYLFFFFNIKRVLAKGQQKYFKKNLACRVCVCVCVCVCVEPHLNDEFTRQVQAIVVVAGHHLITNYLLSSLFNLISTYKEDKNKKFRVILYIYLKYY